MAYKDSKDPRNSASKKKYYDNNRDRYRTRNTARRAHLVAMVRELKSNPCVDCGNSYPFFAMDFDHRDGETKEFDIGTAVRRTWSESRLLTEIAKCDLVCCLCHRFRTARRAGWIADLPGFEPGNLLIQSQAGLPVPPQVMDSVIGADTAGFEPALF